MRKRIAFMLAAVVIAAGLLVTPATAGVTGVRIALTTGTGVPITCGSTVSGVGEIIANGFATATSINQNVTFKTSYSANGSGGGDWYLSFKARPVPNTETKMSQVVQDLAPDQNGSSVTFGFAQSAGYQSDCTVNLTNVPAPDGTLSTRTAPAALLTAMRVQLRDYSTGVPFACNTMSPGGRIAANLFATAPSTGQYDLHIHEERPLPLGTGPDQDMNMANARWWEAALFRVQVGTTETNVGQLTSQLKDDGDKMVHWGQQYLGQGNNNIVDATEQMCDFD